MSQSQLRTQFIKSIPSSATMSSLLKSRRLILFLLLLSMLLMSAACTKEYDFERQQYERGTLGEELFKIWRRDTARSAHEATARVELLDGRQQVFIAAIDRAAPAQELEEVDRFFQESLVLVDEGYIPGLTSKAQIILREGAQHRGLMEALSGDYRPPSHTYVSPVNPANGASHLLRYPELPALMAELGGILVASDGLDDRGRTRPGESTAFSDLLRALKLSMADFQSAAAPDRLPMFLQELLLVEDQRFARVGEAIAPWYVVSYDERGFPKVRSGATGIAHPFVDGNGDGLADIDGQGRFILHNGESHTIPAFSLSGQEEPISRDSQGRAYLVPDQFVFEYIDLHRTALGYVMRAASSIAEEDVLYHLVEAITALFGPPVALEDAEGLYVGFGAGAITELLHALLDSLDLEDLPAFMEAMASLLDHAGSELASLIYAFEHIADVIEGHPEAKLGEDQTLVYDLLPIIAAVIADEGLFHAVLAAFREPISKRGGEPILTLLTHKDPRSVPAPGGAYDACFEVCRDRHFIGTEARFDCIRDCPMHELFALPMDFGAGESPSNRSRLQRLFHLLRDTAGTPYTMLVEEARMPGFTVPDIFPPMIYLPGAAEAYVRAVAGDLFLGDYIPQEFNDSFLGTLVDFLNWLLPGTIDNSTVAAVLSFASGLFGVQLDTYPTPDQITRLFNQESLAFDNGDGIFVSITDPVCKDGFVMAQHHADGLFAAEASGMIDILYPLARAFSAHDRPDLLAEIFVVVHNHYSSRFDLYRDGQNNLSPMKAGNLVSFEPAMKEILEADHLFEALHRIALATGGLKSSDGVDVDEHLRRFLHRLTRTDDGFASRGGRTTLELADGRVLREISRLHIILSELDAVVDRFDDDDEARDHMNRAWRGMMGSVMSTEESPLGGRRFSDEGGLALAGNGMRVLARRARQHQETGQLSDWLTESIVDGVEDAVQSRTFFAAMTLSQDVVRSETMGAHLRGFLSHMAASNQGVNQSASGLYLTLVEAMNRERWIPVLRFLTEMLDPDRVWHSAPMGEFPLGSHLVRALERAAQVDVDGLGYALMARAMERTDSDAPLSVLREMFGYYLRTQPGDHSPLSGDDFTRIFNSLADWLADDHRGMEQVYDLVSRRVR